MCRAVAADTQISNYNLNALLVNRVPIYDIPISIHIIALFIYVQKAA